MILPCSSWLAGDAWLISGDWGIGETALAVHLFLVFLSCSCYLVTYPAALSMDELMARVLAMKSFYMPGERTSLTLCFVCLMSTLGIYLCVLM